MRISDWSSDVCSSDLFVEMAFFDFMLGEVEQVAANVGGIDIAARARVAGLAPAAVEMRDDLRAQRDVDRAADIAVVGRGRITADRVAIDLVGGAFAGDAAVEHIHGPADPITAATKGESS